jgi:hypothetical protein
VTSIAPQPFDLLRNPTFSQAGLGRLGLGGRLDPRGGRERQPLRDDCRGGGVVPSTPWALRRADLAEGQHRSTGSG